MTREFLKSLELSDEVIEKIIIEHGLSVQKTQEELSAANDRIKNLQDAAKKFEDVDVEKLKNDISAWKSKYDNDITQMRLDAAINLGLQAAGARNAKLLRGAIDTAKIKLDGETAAGLSEQIEELKKSDPYLFEAGAGAGMGAGVGASAGAPGRNYAFAGSTGMYSGSPVPDLSALSDAEYYARVMKQS